MKNKIINIQDKSNYYQFIFSILLLLFGWTLESKAQSQDEISFERANIRANEGDQVAVRVRRTRTPSGGGGPVTVTIATRDGTAIAGSDYVARSGTLSWTAGETGLKSFNVRINTDNANEADETVELALSSPTGGAVLAEPSTARITITGTGGQFTDLPGINTSQIAVAGALDELCPRTQSAQLRGQCANLAVLGDQDLSQALQSIAPEEAAALAPSGTQTTQAQVSNLKARLTALRGGTRGLSLDGLAFGIGDGSLPMGNLVDVLVRQFSGGSAGAEDVLGGSGGRLGVFVNGRLDFGDHDATSREAGYDFNTLGITAGVDYRFTDQFVLGGALGYASTDTEFDSDGGTLDNKSFSLALYGTYYTSTDFYIDSILSYGRNDYASKRNIVYPNVNTTARGDTNGTQWGASLSVGKDFHRNEWLISPYLRLDYVRSAVDGFNEKGGAGLALAIGDQDITSFTSDLGFRVSRSTSLSWGVLTPTASLEWEHEFKDSSQFTTSRFLADPSVPFSIPTDNPDRNYFNLGVGMAAAFSQGRSAFVSYEGVFGQDHYATHKIQAGIRFEF